MLAVSLNLEMFSLKLPRFVPNLQFQTDSFQRGLEGVWKLLSLQPPQVPTFHFVSNGRLGVTQPETHAPPRGGSR